MLDFILKVSGQQFDGWESAQIVKTMNSLSGSFSLQFTDSWEINNANWFIAPGDSVEVFIGNRQFVSGYVDALSASIDPNARTIEATGRDATADLVDCMVEGPFEFQGISFEQLAKRVCEPFGIDVFRKTGVGTLIDSGVNVGSTVFDLLDQEARKQGFLLNTDGLGRLVIDVVSTQRIDTEIKEGVNVKTASVGIDHSDRYSRYTVKAQKSGSDIDFGVQTSEIQAQATDRGIKRYRPFVGVANLQSNPSQATQLVRWESASRAANSEVISVTVPSWTQGDSAGRKSPTDFWEVNRIVFADIPSLGVKGEFLISEVSFSISPSGEIAVLSLRRPDAFITKPVIEEDDDILAGLRGGG